MYGEAAVRGLPWHSGRAFFAMQEFRKRYSGPSAPLPGLPDWESELLRARGIDTPEKAERFLHPDLDQLQDPLRMQDMERALELIRGAIREGRRILVYGDYDADGICAVTVMLETLREEGADVSFRIPARHSEGYGLNEQAIREIAAAGYGLLITVDCGIANAGEVRLARELGMQVIVTDHHEIPETLPPADAVLDPLLGEYPFRRLCGAGVALKICQALQGRAGMERKLEIAALATVADIVPLTEENRVIVREGMLRMERTSRPGLQALMRNAGIVFPMHSDDIAFRLGPRLNAAGRLEDAAQAVALLTTEDPAEAKRIADHLEENNRRRQEAEQQILREALTLFPLQVRLRQDRAIILEGENWNTGLIGLAAGKLCERFHHPVIVLSRQEDQAVGSCRSVPGVNIWEMLNRCADLYLRFGGHAQAAGLTLPADRIPEFRRRLNDVLRENCDERCFLPVKEYDSELPLSEVTLEMVDRLEALEPTGFGNPAPAFLCRGADVQEARRVGRDGSHLKLSLHEGGTVRDGIGFGLGDAADQVLHRADIVFRPGRNEFNGRVSAQLQVQAIRAACGEEDGENTGPDEFFLRCLQEMVPLSAKKTDYPSAQPAMRPEYLLKDRLDRVDPSREALGNVYRALRDFSGSGPEALADQAGVSREQALFALTAFEQLGLLRWELHPFRVELIPAVRRMDLEQSPAVRYLRELG